MNNDEPLNGTWDGLYQPFMVIVGDGFLLGLPTGNQTWLAGKWTIETGDFPS